MLRHIGYLSNQKSCDLDRNSPLNKSNKIINPTVQFSWYCANSRCCWWCDALSIGTFFFVADWRPASFNTFLTVWGVTGAVIVEFMNLVAWTALSSLPELIWWIIDRLSQGERQPPGWFSLSPTTSWLILPIVPFSRPVLACTWRWEYLLQHTDFHIMNTWYVGQARLLLLSYSSFYGWLIRTYQFPYPLPYRRHRPLPLLLYAFYPLPSYYTRYALCPSSLCI